jgi:hypothetical protein
MEEHLKDAIILTTILRSAKGLRWGSSSEVKYLKDGRVALEYLKLDLDFDTAQQAERAGLVFSKKWVHRALRRPE